MPSILQTIEPRSDQRNYDDFIGIDHIDIKITRVDVNVGTDQPLIIHYEGDNGKPYKPSKGMRRVIALIWGPDSETFVGRSMRLYGDATVKFGGEDVGGIRISHMSDLDRPMTMALTMSKAKRKAFTVRPLHVALGPDRRQLEETAQKIAADGVEAFRAWHKTLSPDERAYLKPTIGTYQDIATKADIARSADPAASSEPPGAG